MSKTEKVEFLWDFLFEEEDKLIRWQRFETAAEIASVFGEIKKRLRAKLAKSIYDRLKLSPAFSDLVIEDKGFLQGQPLKSLMLYKPAWVREEPLFSYTLEFGQNDTFYYGTLEFGQNDTFYYGVRKSRKVPDALRQSVKPYLEAWGLRDAQSPQWLAWNYFDGEMGKDSTLFLKSLVTRCVNGGDGCNDLVSRYLITLDRMINNLERYIDTWVKRF